MKKRKSIHTEYLKANQNRENDVFDKLIVIKLTNCLIN